MKNKVLLFLFITTILSCNKDENSIIIDETEQENTEVKGTEVNLKDNTIIIGNELIDLSPGIICSNSTNNTSIEEYSKGTTNTGGFSMVFFDIIKVGTYKFVATSPKEGEVSFSVNDTSIIRKAFSGGTLTVTENSSGKKILTATNITLKHRTFSPGDHPATTHLKLICL